MDKHTLEQVQREIRYIEANLAGNEAHIEDLRSRPGTVKRRATLKDAEKHQSELQQRLIELKSQIATNAELFKAAGSELHDHLVELFQLTSATKISFVPYREVRYFVPEERKWVTSADEDIRVEYHTLHLNEYATLDRSTFIRCNYAPKIDTLFIYKEFSR